MTESEIIYAVREYVEENLLYAAPPGFVLSEQDSLIDRGVIDSMGVLEVLGYLEETFGIIVDDEEVTSRNLGSLGAIARFVVAKRASMSVV